MILGLQPRAFATWLRYHKLTSAVLDVSPSEYRPAHKATAIYNIVSPKMGEPWWQQQDSNLRLTTYEVVLEPSPVILPYTVCVAHITCTS